MHLVTQFALLKISNYISISFPGIVIPIAINAIIYTGLGMIGLGWDWLGTDVSHTYETFGFAILLFIVMGILKFGMWGWNDVNKKEMVKEKPLLYLLYLSKNLVKAINYKFAIWCTGQIVIFAADWFMFHWFTTKPLQNFYWSMLILISAGFVAQVIFTTAFFFIDTKADGIKLFGWDIPNPFTQKTRLDLGDPIIYDGLEIMDITWYVIQLPLFNFAVWGGYEGFHKKIGWTQSISIITCGGIWLVTNVIITSVSRVLKETRVGYGKIKKSKKTSGSYRPMFEDEDVEEEELDDIDADLLTMD